MLLIAGVLWPLIWFGFALTYVSMTTWRLPPPVAIRMPACWRCLSPRRASGISTVWRRGRRHLSSAICVACSQLLPSEELRWQVAEAEDFSASVQLLADYCAQQQVSHLFYNYQYEINERQRDAAVEKRLSGVVCHGFDDALLLSPGSVLTGNHEMYKVFTPFKNAFLRRLREALPECVAAPTVRGHGPLTPAPLPEIRYPQEAFDPHLLPTMRKRLSPDCAVSASKKPPIMTSA